MSQPRGASVGPSVGQTVGGKYRLTRLIGQGGMGTVYEAQDLGLGRGVAVKFLQSRVAHDFGLVERFMREAKATAAIAHPHIVDVFDVGWTDDGELPYFVMELLDGKNLTAELRASGTMSVDRAVGIMVQVLDALEAAHGKGFIHRDLKPENIFIIRHGLEEDVKVLDFGITKAIGGQDASLTHTGAVLGTPAYMSPEQARGSREIDHRTDLYAAGAIIFELITGRPPHEGETYNEIIIKIATEEPPAIQSLRPGVHPALAGVIHKALARDPEQRWPSCAAMIQALHEVLDDVHTSTGILAEHDAGNEPTSSTLKPTPTAWEVTAPASIPRASRKVALEVRPAEEPEQIDSDPDERTKALVSKIATPSGGVQPWKAGPVIRIGPGGAAASLSLAEDTSSLPVTDSLHEETGSLQNPEPSAMTGSFSAVSAANRTRTVAILAVVGLLTGAGTYLIGGWVLDAPPPAPDGESGDVLTSAVTGSETPAPPAEQPPRLEPEAPPLVAPVVPIPETPPVPPPPAPDCRVRATVVTPRAAVVLDGSRAGAEIDLPSACGSIHILEVSAPGHAPLRLELTAREVPDPWRVELEELAEPAPPRPPRETGRPPRSAKRNPRLEPNPF
jgi:serine/threonine-protein kinase